MNIEGKMFQLIDLTGPLIMVQNGYSLNNLYNMDSLHFATAKCWDFIKSSEYLQPCLHKNHLLEYFLVQKQRIFMVLNKVCLCEQSLRQTSFVQV